ncbi:hypothetical protein LBMAG53_19500 [Planctomycetota bacterium]|nr:hypothetical protein LBMAG53_19500 [Planctomycetota bacterium]
MGSYRRAGSHLGAPHSVRPVSEKSINQRDVSPTTIGWTNADGGTGRTECGAPCAPDAARPGAPHSVRPVSQESRIQSEPSHTTAGWTRRGYLPHWNSPSTIQSITYRLDDSLPLEVLDRLRQDSAYLPDEERQRVQRRRIDDLLDAGLGSCVLRHPAAAAIVEQAWRHFDGDRYRLLAWTVMPNHVHVLIEPASGWTVGKLVHGWKSFTILAINRLRLGPIVHWQRDYWDRWIRDEDHLLRTIGYIDGNPVKAGLVVSAADWPWGSAHHAQRTCAAWGERIGGGDG